jgi:hypothetical protein
MGRIHPEVGIISPYCKIVQHKHPGTAPGMHLYQQSNAMEAIYPKLRHNLPVIMKRRGMQFAAQRTPYQGYFTERRRECQVELHKILFRIAKNYAISPKRRSLSGSAAVDRVGLP